MILSNGELNGVRDQVRQNALEDFAFFANTVLASGIAEDVCAVVQDVVLDREDYLVHTKRPRALAVALQAWLTSRGVSVLSTASCGSHEILNWLELNTQDEHCALDRAATLEILAQGVQITWL